MDLRAILFDSAERREVARRFAQNASRGDAANETMRNVSERVPSVLWICLPAAGSKLSRIF